MPRTSLSAPFVLVLTCEHAVNRVPRAYAGLFDDMQDVLNSHRGYDPGALKLARRLHDATGAPLFSTDVSRLLVECNRSLHHKDLFSSFARSLDAETKQEILDKHYLPHRERVLASIEEAIQRGRTVLHVGVHSFTPVLHGQERRADIGILYDPTRPAEARFATRWQAELESTDPTLRVRRNYPYRGVSDGLTTALRRSLPAHRYLGIELEVNNKHLATADTIGQRRVTEVLKRSLLTLLAPEQSDIRP